MTKRFVTRGTVCIAALLAGGMAQADVTAQDVWDDWKAQMSLYGDDGLSIGAEEVSGDTITVRDLAINYSDDEVTLVSDLGDLVFEGRSDGTVAISMAESYPMTITAEDGTVVNILVTQSGLEMIVSGDPDAMNFDLTADQYQVALVDIVSGDVTLAGDARLTANDIAGSYTSTTGDMRNMTYDMTLASVDLLIDFQMPGGAGEYLTAAAKYTDMSVNGEVTIPEDADFEKPEELFAAGFGFSGGYEIAKGEFVMDTNADGDQFAASGTNGAGSLTAEFSSERVSYDADVNDVAMSIRSSDFPMPIDISMARYGFGIDIPTGAMEEAGDLGLRIDLVDVAISDAIWGMFDPGAVLPRDPATIQIELAGKAKTLINIFDPEQAAMMGDDDMPYELQSMNLETLNISVAGAQVTGEGAFTFDNSDMQTFAPMPRPEGEATIEISGLNALLDNLVAAGLVPADQVMGPRMMMGMFMRNTGDDQMATTVEVTPSGAVNVNGNRVR